MYNRVIIGDAFEEKAREDFLRSSGSNNPTKKSLCASLEKLIKKKFDEIGERVVKEKQQPETWIQELKKEMKEAF